MRYLPAGIILLGLVQGSLAALNSLGFVLLWRTTRLVNLAQPALGLVGGVLVGMLVVSGGWSFWFALPVGLLVGAALGFFSDRVVLRRLQDAPRAVLLVATVGLAGVFGAMASAVPFIFDGPLPTYTINLGVTWDVAPVRLLGPHILTLIVFPIALVATHRFLHRSRLGLAALALGQDTERARALGVPAPMVRSIVWVVAGMLATLSGVLSIPTLGFSLGGGLGPTVLLLALAPAVLAGFRSLVGAAAAALALGVAYQGLLWNSSDGSLANLVLGGAVLLAFAAQRRRLGRAETAARASSWEAAVTPRPLPWELAGSTIVRVAGVAFALVVLVAVALPPLFLDPGGDVLYATSVATALGVLSIAVAWIFAGEVALGHWGMAGIGAWVASSIDAPLAVRAVAATAVVAAFGAALAVASRRRSSLAYAVLGLAVAASAPVLLLSASTRSVSLSPGPVGSVAAVLVALVAIGVARLRATSLGARMVAARDDPARAPWLGASPMRGRVTGLTISAALAGLAGALYLFSVPAGLPPASFDAVRSLEILSFAVIGGLSSPAGAISGAGIMLAAQHLLADPWKGLASGTGVLLVVIFRPAGLSRVIVVARDRIVSLLASAGARGRTKTRGPSLTGHEVSAPAIEGGEKEPVRL